MALIQKSSKKIDVKDFKQLLETHPAANHEFFDWLEDKAKKGLTVQEYQDFAMNYIARTVWTIPEVAQATAEAARDLRIKGMAFGGATTSEETGEGNEERVHSMLMLKAINCHGMALYGENYKPINAVKILDITRTAYEAFQAQSFNYMDDTTKGILEKRGVFNFGATDDNINNILRKYFGKDEMIPNHKNNIMPLYSAITLKLISELKNMGIHDNVISYGFEQIAVMNSQERGKLQGCAFAHEGFADKMMFTMFKLMHAGKDQYKNPGDFDKNIYPYFEAHGDYYAMLKGAIEVNKGEGVEAEHARREFAKIAELPSELIGSAYDGAKEFADRQFLVWNGIMESMQNSVEQNKDFWIKRVKIPSNIIKNTYQHVSL